MAETTYFINEETLIDIADAIRAKDGTSTPMTASEMSTRINNISTGITNNATYTLDVEQGTSTINPGKVRADINIRTAGIMTSGWKYGEWETVENCSSENIKSGVTILGVTGTYSGTSSYNGPYTYLGTLTSSGYYSSDGIPQTSNPHMIIFNSALPNVRLYNGGTGKSIYGGVSGGKTILVYSGEESMTNLQNYSGATGYVYSI